MAFMDYYNGRFSRDITDLFISYKNTGTDMVFLGFHKDSVAHMDPFFMKGLLRDLPFSGGSELANFAMGMWAMSATDICAYCKYPYKEYRWFSKTGYPKITGWNYYAVKPNWIFGKLAELFPEAGLKARIEQIIENEGGYIVDRLANDVFCLLGDEQKELEEMRSFLRSWLKTDGNGEPFEPECFLRPCRRLGEY